MWKQVFSTARSTVNPRRNYYSVIAELVSVLVENGISMFIWIGLQAGSDLLQQLFHANTIGQVDIEMVTFSIQISLYRYPIEIAFAVCFSHRILIIFLAF